MKLSRHLVKLPLAFLTLVATVALTGAVYAADHGYRTIYRFQGGNDGWFPVGVPVADKDGNLYGTAQMGGTYNYGIVFKLTAPQGRGGAWTKTVLHNFAGGSDGGFPVAVLLGKDGSLYGISSYADRIFRLSPPTSRHGVWKNTVLYSLNETTDGSYIQGLALDAEGNLYGAAGVGGDLGCGNGFGCGTVFELKRPTKMGGKWHFTVLHTFTGDPDGMEPFAGVTLDQQGNVYGTTNWGGAYGWGAVYRVAPPKTKGGAWKETVVYSLDSGSDMGSHPDGPVIFDSSGNIYGTAAFGGDLNCQGGAGCGTVFKLTPPNAENADWTSTTLYNFQGGSDGAVPKSNMVLDRLGDLYGTTNYGGTGQAGTAFRLNPSNGSWTETVLHWFPDGKKDGYDPVSGLTWGKWGDLYGIACVGGNPSCSQDGCGTVFEVQP